MSFRIDLYFSYWVILYAILSFIYNINFPFITLLLCIIIQYFYINKNIDKILNQKKNYIVIGNFIIVILKYIFLILGILYKRNKYLFLNEFKIMLGLFAIFNIYYYINVKKIYYVLTLNMNDIKIDKGPSVYLFKILLNNS